MDTWQPLEQGKAEICSLLREYLHPTVDQTIIWNKLQSLNQIPDFNNYLTSILCSAKLETAEVRQAAGLLLKSNINVKDGFKTMAAVYQQYIKLQLISCIGDADKRLRSTIGSVISVVLQQVGINGWPEIMPAFVQCIDSNDYNHMEGAMDALFKICEDIPDQMDSEIPGLGDRPVSVFFPRFVQLFQSPHTTIRKLALASANQFITPFPMALFVHIESYLQGVFALSNDPEPEVRKLVCSAIVQMVMIRAEYLEPNVKNVIEFMLQATQDADQEVALEACEFWSSYCDVQLPIELLADILPRLITVLLTNMVYADDDEELIEAEEDSSAPDRDQDLRPRFHKSKAHGGEDEDDDDDDIVRSWNLRKCSAAAVDALSSQIGDDLLPYILPHVQTRLSVTDADRWKEREVAVLTMGAIADGCMRGLLPMLPQLVVALVPLLEDPHPLVRSIACWTLSRYGRWMAEEAGPHSEAGTTRIHTVAAGILSRIVDPNKKVQTAACSAFANLIEDAGEHLLPLLEPTLLHLMKAFEMYQRANLRILYDAIATLAESVGSELSQGTYLNILMPPLMARWQQLSNADKDLLPMLECLTSIAKALGQGFAPYAEGVFSRCLAIIRGHLHAMTLAEGSVERKMYDKDFIVYSLDLLSGMAEGWGPGLNLLIGSSDLVALLLLCCSHDSNDVRQSALALLGDLSKDSISHLQPRLGEFLTVAISQLSADNLVLDKISVANNACWAIGELSVKVREEIIPHVMPLLGHLVPILTSYQNPTKRGPLALAENCAITLGRVAAACPDQLAPLLDHFGEQWCYALGMIHDGVEKEDAFRGLCILLRLNPSSGAKFIVPICEASGSWDEIHNQYLRSDLSAILHGFKQLLGEVRWSEVKTSLLPEVSQKLSKKYGI